MNKNSESYKNTYSQLRPSAEAVERVMDMTSEKKIRFKPVVKRLVAAAIVLAILVGGGLGINLSPKQSEYNDELGVLIAYAKSHDYYEVGNDIGFDMLVALYVVPEHNEEKADEVLKRWNSDYDEYNDRLREAGYATYKSTKGIGCYNALNIQTACLYIIHGGSFALDLEDYSEVKTLKVENTSKYGELYLDTDIYGRLGYTDTFPSSVEEFAEQLVNHFKTINRTREIEISGDALRRSQASHFYEKGNADHTVNKGYGLQWWPSEELGKAIGNNLNFDLSKVKDTIRFTVEFNDGTVKTGSIDLYFDSDGYMHFGK